MPERQTRLSLKKRRVPTEREKTILERKETSSRGLRKKSTLKDIFRCLTKCFFRWRNHLKIKVV